MKTIEFHYPMIQLLIKDISSLTQRLYMEIVESIL